MKTGRLRPFFSRLEESSGERWEGRVLRVASHLVESEGPFCSVGESCEITDRRGNYFHGEIIGFRGPRILSMCQERPSGLR